MLPAWRSSPHLTLPTPSNLPSSSSPPPPPHTPSLLLHHFPSSITSAPTPLPTSPPPPSSPTSPPPSPPHHPPPTSHFPPHLPTSPPAQPPSVHRSFVFFFNWLLCVRGGRRWAPTVTCFSLPGLVVPYVFSFPIHTGQQGASPAPTSSPATRCFIVSPSMSCCQPFSALSPPFTSSLPATPSPYPPPPPHTHTHTHTYTHTSSLVPTMCSSPNHECHAVSRFLLCRLRSPRLPPPPPTPPPPPPPPHPPRAIPLFHI